MSPEPTLSRVLLDERVKYMTIGGFKSRVKQMQRCEFEAFKHFEDVWQIEEEAVLVPYDMYLRIQAELLEKETRQ